MEAGSMIKIALTAVGIVIMLSSFYFLAIRKMTADLAVLWEIIGFMLLLAGAFPWPRLSLWIQRIQDMGPGGEGEKLVVFMGTAGLCACYLFSLLISHLMLRNHEMAIELSLLRARKDKEEQKRKKDLLLILPVKNEEENVGKVLDDLVRQGADKIADILCINDDSSDNSGQVIDRYPCMQITALFSLGYGSALKLGYKYAVREGYQYVIQMDADGQHDACNIPLIYQKLREGGDIVLASRFMEGSSEFPVSIFKRFAFWLFRSMIKAAAGRRIADPATGLQGLNRKAFSYYSGYNHFDYQYPDANMVLQMLLLQFQLVEVPAVMHVRTDGKSMHSGLEPAGYMMRMFLSVLAVLFRHKALRMK